MKYKNIIFDLDGTLAHTQPGITNGIIYASSQMGITNLPIEKTELYIGPSLQKFLKENSDLSSDQRTEFITHMRKYYLETGYKESSLYDGIYELIQLLNQNQLNVYVCTAKYEVSAKKMINFYNLDKYCKSVLGANDILHEKSELLKHLIQSFDLDPLKSVMIGDRYTDILGGKDNNCATIGVLYGYGSSQEINECSPDYIADSAQSIKNYILEG